MSDDDPLNAYAWSNDDSPCAADRHQAQKADRDDERDPDLARLQRVLTTIDERFRAQVDGWVKKWNQVIRESLRTQTALRLSVGEDRAAVPIRVTDGMPLPLRSAFARLDDDQLAVVLRLPQIIQAQAGLKFLGGHPFARDRKLQWLIERQPTIRSTGDVVQQVLKQIGLDQLVETVANINEDVLGAYFFNIPEIRIYWMSIGFVSSMLNIDPEALTVVVLAHELAHAYTHKGQDIDGKRWEDGFGQSDLVVVEGLAQFYTLQVCRDLSNRQPLAERAFCELMNHQSTCYQAFAEWIPETAKSTGEIIRFGMLDVRRKAKVAHRDMLDAVDHVCKRFDNSTEPASSGSYAHRNECIMSMLSPLAERKCAMSKTDLLATSPSVRAYWRETVLYLLSCGLIRRHQMPDGVTYLLTKEGANFEHRNREAMLKGEQ